MSLEACATASGSGFLRSSLYYLDCAGRELGSTGYIALTQPGSPIFQLILVAITFLIAWHGIWMMLGRTPDMGDAVMMAAKIGIVLMLTTSWPAVRTLFAEPVVSGPSELVAQSGLTGGRRLEARLQRVDDGIVALTKWGTGKLDIRAGRTADGQPAATEFSGIALTDSLALGIGRISFLVGALMSLGMLKLLSGIMIAALPLIASLLLFEATRGLFWGWLKLMFALLIAGFAVPLLLTVELALIEPWLARAISQRSASFAAPSAPTELVAMSTSFLFIVTASMALIVRACLTADLMVIAGRLAASRPRFGQAEAPALKAEHMQAAARQRAELTRAANIATSISRIDQLPRSGAFQTGIADRPAGQSQPAIELRRGTGPAGRQRARQRMALSQLRRNQR
jgi:type IV secretion system protein VirB6